MRPHRPERVPDIYAVMLVERDEPGDREKAVEPQD
jgi:hypothetical protein